MNVLDLAIVTGIAGAAFGGYRLGFLTRASSWLGLLVGAMVGARLAPAIIDRVAAGDPQRALFITAASLLAGSFVGQLVGQLIGHQLRVRAAAGRRAAADRALGAVSGAAVVLALVWMVAPAMRTGAGWPARLVDGSVLAARIDELTPDPPDPWQTASRLVGTDQWEQLQAQLGGGMPGPDIPDLDPPDAALDRRIRAATVLVEHAVCDRGVQDGTGFVAADGLVVTNAHVVAGVPDPGASVLVVTSDRRQHRGRVVVFDPVSDLAVLRVEGLDAEPLALAERAERDATGWVYGHPGGQSLQVRAFRTGTETDARVPDIYEQGAVLRRIVPVRADLDHGDSGSALVALDGSVIGVAFAISPEDDSLAVAVAMRHVLAAVEQALAAGPDAAEVGTGPCTP